MRSVQDNEFGNKWLALILVAAVHPLLLMNHCQCLQVMLCHLANMAKLRSFSKFDKTLSNSTAVF